MKDAERDADETLRSGPYELVMSERRLTCDGRPIELSAQLLRLLAVLMRREGRVVARQNLKDALWPGLDRIDTERRLNTAMRGLRKALGEDAGRPPRPETVRGRGYRWNPPAPARRIPAPRRWAAAACLMAVAASSAPQHLRPAFDTAPVDGDFLRARAAADADPAQAAAARDALLGRSPAHAPALILRAELAVRAWREAPTAANLNAARRLLAVARAATGDHPGLEAPAGELAMFADWDLSEAERRYARALAHDSTSAEAHRGLAWVYVNSGRFSEARREVDLLLAETPLTPALRADVGWLLLRLGRPDEAATLCEVANSDHLNLLACRHTARARLGDMSSARLAAAEFMAALDAPRDAVAAVRTGSPEDGYRSFLTWRTRGFFPADGHWFHKAQLYAEAGRVDDALASLERAVEARDPDLIKLASTREFAALRNDPRFAAVKSAVGLDRG